MDYYQAKFKREQKARPMDWLILPHPGGGCRLAHLPQTRNCKHERKN